MDNALYVGLSNQQVLLRQMDIVANNIANADTTGFKVESLISKETPAAPAFTMGGPRPVKFVTADGVARDFSQGGLRKTDAPFDVAIEGQGFFKVTTKAGDRFTRDGHFRMDDTGRITTQAGDPVADTSGAEITIDPTRGQISIASDGTISQGADTLGKIGVYKFDTLGALTKSGANLYENTSNQQPTAAPDSKVRVGMLEGSNVQPLLEITRMIEVSRAYESVTQLMSSQSDLTKEAITRMGKLQ